VVTGIAVVFFLTGAALHVFYTAHPEKGGLAINPDRVMSKFILEELPPGWRGLLMAAVAAAAMSSISSILNSLTAVASADFIGSYKKEWMTVRTARAVTVAIGILATGAALYVERMGNILIAGTRMQNFLGGSLAGGFLLGMTSRRANAKGAFWGIVLGTAAVAGLSSFTRISWMWHGIFAAGVAYFGGLALSLMTGRPPDSVQELVWRPGAATQESKSIHAELNCN